MDSRRQTGHCDAGHIVSRIDGGAVLAIAPARDDYALNSRETDEGDEG
jgi:hypothetical protein